MTWLHVGDLEGWNEETHWEWDPEPKAHLVPGWGWVVVHFFKSRPDWPSMPESDKEKWSHALAIAVYRDMGCTERKALFVLDGNHMRQSFPNTQHFMPAGWTFDYWQSH